MENVSYDGEPFGLLPDEMVVYVLSFVDVDSLLSCRLVCQNWKQFIDAYVFQEKAAYENEFVNDGRGFYSFSAIDSKTVRKLDFPWYVFYVISKHDPFNRNLVKNNCGQNLYKHWILNTRSNLWTIEQHPVGAPALPNDPDFEGHTSCFVSTYRLCSKYQKIVFKNYGLTKSLMKLLQPEIVVSEWYSGRFDCGCKYELRVTVQDSNDKLLEQHNYNDTIQLQDENVWTKVSHSFKNQSDASSLILFHSGVDTQFWAGHYGSKISGAVVKVMIPIKLKGVEC